MKLRLVYYKVNSDSELCVQPQSYVVKDRGIITSSGENINNISGGILFRTGDSNREVRGAKAFLNIDNKYNLTIKNQQSDKGNVVRAYLQFSLPKIKNGNNYFECKNEDVIPVLTSIKEDLYKRGIDTELTDDQATKLSRLDLFRNVNSDYDYSAYRSILSVISPKQMKTRDYGSTFLYENSQAQVCVYDKLEEMRINKVDLIVPDNNAIRFELRMLNSKKLSSMFDDSDLRVGLLNDFDKLNSIYNGYYSKNVFNLNMDKVVKLNVVSEEQLIEEFEYYKLKFGRNWLDYYIKINGLARIQESNNREVLISAVSKFLFDDRMAVKRFRDKVEELYKVATISYYLDTHKVENRTLYDELKSKVILVA